MFTFDSIVLRTPTESLDNVFSLPEKIEPIFKEGLYLASREFYKQLAKIEHLTENEKSKLNSSLLKYWIRSSIRCTPFGTFAGSAVIELTDNENEEIILNDSEFHVRKARLDMGYIQYLINELEKMPVVQQQITLFPNNSIYETDFDLRYTETVTIDFQNEYKLSSVLKSDYVQYIIGKAINGLSIDELVSLLADFAMVEAEEAREFILEMWHSNLLVSNLQPNLTGKDPFVNLISSIENLYGIDTLRTNLKTVLDNLFTLKDGPESYINAENIINQLSIKPQGIKEFIQTDLYLSCLNKNINRDVVSTLVEQVNDLMPFARQLVNADLEEFKKTFHEKYGNKKIPLAMALDFDIGVGYSGIKGNVSGGNPLIDDIGYPSGGTTQISTDRIQDYSFIKYLEFLDGNHQHIEVTEKDISNFKNTINAANFPASLHIQGSLFKKNNALNKENFLFSLISTGGPSGANLLGRFTPGDNELLELSKNILSIEEKANPEIIFAEIVHLPQSRIGNVLLRPVLRKYEIPYVGKSGAEPNDQILINDLYVCIRDNEIILVSKELNKRVMPRLTTAHNFGFKSLPIYKFLCDLQYQGVAIGPIWDWGRLDSRKSLPRVIYKNIIIKKARWTIETNELTKLPESEDDYKEFFNHLIAARKIPRQTVLVESDNQILIDFDQLECILILLRYLKKQKTAFLEEFLFTTENCIVKDNNGQSYTNEIIIPVHKPHDNIKKLNSILFSENIINKKYYPGSKWLFIKIFASANTIDKLLIQYILPFIEKNLREKLFEKFFFVRYKEHGNHLRLRFYSKDPNCHVLVLNQLLEHLDPLLQSDLIERVVLDTYVPEAERYGGEKLLKEAEELFAADSLATMKILNLIEPGIEDNYRILFSMRSIDAFLNDFQYSIQNKRDLFKNLSKNFQSEFGSHSSLQKNINNKYKGLQRIIFSFMDDLQDSNNELMDLSDILCTRSLEVKSAIKRINKILENSDNKILLEDLLMSYIHMMMNRFFVSHQRKYELIIYTFLERYYTSLVSMNLNRRSKKI